MQTRFLSPAQLLYSRIVDSVFVVALLAALAFTFASAAELPKLSSSVTSSKAEQALPQPPMPRVRCLVVD